MSNIKTNFRVVGTRPIRHDGVDKVTGRANYGADFHLPGMLHGIVLRSPYPHARIKSIDTSAARALDGVLSVITGKDFPENIATEIKSTAHNVIARDHVRYQGHAVAAVASTSIAIGEKAAKLIKVEYEILPHVTDVMEAAKNKIIIDPELNRITGNDSTPTNICKTAEFIGGNINSGFSDADIVIEREFDSATIHQGYIEPHACVARKSEDGKILLWVSSQGHFAMRNQSAEVLGINPSQIKAIPAEIGGGFGGKTCVYLEPLCILLAEKTARPVKMVMNRSEVFLATGPAPGSHIRLKLGAKKDGYITAVEAEMWFESGGFPGNLLSTGMECLIAPYNVKNFSIHGYNVLVNKPFMRPYRAPLAPNASHATETVVDEICREIQMDPLDFRLLNAAHEGTQRVTGLPYPKIGAIETVQAASSHPHYKAPLGPNQGRGVASGFWMNFGGDATANISILPDGKISLVTGRPDIGGTRAMQAMVVAEELGINIDQVIPSIGDTETVGSNGITEGSSTAFSTSIAICKVCEKLILLLKERASLIWEEDLENIKWHTGSAHLMLSSNQTGKTLTIRELAKTSSQTGGPLTAQAALNAKSAAPAFGTHICDVEVDPEIGKVSIIRYTVCQDAGRALHKDYVEGQYQGGAAQGIGWALNEGYFYNDDGLLENDGFLDYRMPVAIDLPMIDPVIIEVPNPKHPYGVRGVGENSIAAPLAAVANAIYDAAGIRLRQVPMSPSKILAAIMSKKVA